MYSYPSRSVTDNTLPQGHSCYFSFHARELDMNEQAEHSHNGIPPNYTRSYFIMYGILRFLFTVAFATRPYPFNSPFHLSTRKTSHCFMSVCSVKLILFGWWVGLYSTRPFWFYASKTILNKPHTKYNKNDKFSIRYVTVLDWPEIELEAPRWRADNQPPEI